MQASIADFIIVGGGSAGCVLANRLSEGGRCRVALIEAGPADRNPWIHFGKTMWNKKLNWAFHTEPDPNMNGRQVNWPRGKVLGGSSSINGLIAIRGQPQDYDHWHKLGCGGWSWAEVLPYFRKIESNMTHENDQLHGAHGQHEPPRHYDWREGLRNDSG